MSGDGERRRLTVYLQGAASEIASDHESSLAAFTAASDYASASGLIDGGGSSSFSGQWNGDLYRRGPDGTLTRVGGYSVSRIEEGR